MLQQALYLNAMVVAEIRAALVVCFHAADNGPCLKTGMPVMVQTRPLRTPVFMQDFAEDASVLDPFQKMLQFALEPLLNASTATMQAGLCHTFSLITYTYHACITK